MHKSQLLWQQSASEVITALRDGEISIQDTLDSLETRVNDVDDRINALPTRCFDRARQRAEELEKLPPHQRGALAGLPVTIKDLTPVEGVRTTFGCAIYKDHIPQESCRMVQQIERNGGIVYAKSNTPEFGTGGITFNDVFGLTRSPRNLHFASGGSSGGAAASLASGCAWLSQGSDMAGSLRTPASFCGVTSLRPSPGIIRSDSEYSPYGILGAEGPMARNVTDLALFFNAMRTDDLDSDTRLPGSGAIRVALSEDLGIAEIDDDIRQGFNAFESLLSENAWDTVRATPDLNGVHETFDVLRAHEYAIGLEQTLKDHPGIMKPEVEWNIHFGLSLSSDQLRSASRTQGQIISRATQFMQNYEVLICPATSVSSVSAELRYPGSDSGVPISEYYRWLAIAYATTVTALPIVTLPYRTTDSGMPLALQLVGKPYGETALLAIAKEIEKLIGWDSTPIDPQG